MTAPRQAKPHANIPLAPTEGAFASHLEPRAKCRQFGVCSWAARGGPLRCPLFSRRSRSRSRRSFVRVNSAVRVKCTPLSFRSCSVRHSPAFAVRSRPSVIPSVRPSVIDTPHPSMRPPSVSVSTSVRPSIPPRARPYYGERKIRQCPPLDRFRRRDAPFPRILSY